jgi:hypothetical protein
MHLSQIEIPDSTAQYSPAHYYSQRPCLVCHLSCERWFQPRHLSISATTSVTEDLGAKTLWIVDTVLCPSYISLSTLLKQG